MKFKSVLGAFLIVLLACLVALVMFVQTQAFGRIVTRIVSDISEKHFAEKISVKKISLSFFPPGIELNEVEVRKTWAQGKELKLDLGKIGFYVGLIEFEEKNLSLGEIRITDSRVVFNTAEKSEDLKEIDKKIIKQIFQFDKWLPMRVDVLYLENTLVHINRDLVEIKKLKIFKKDETFMTRFQLSNIKPVENSDFIIDEAWGDAEISRTDINIYRIRLHHDVHTLLIKGKVLDYYKLKDAEAKLNGEVQFYLNGLKELVTLPEIIKIKSGTARLGFNLHYKNRDIIADSDLYMENIKSSILNANEIRSVFMLDNKKLILKKLNVVHEKEKAEILESVEVCDFEKNKFLHFPIKLGLEHFTIGNALKILGPGFRPLRGELSGELSFSYSNKDLFFVPRDNFVVRNLGLVTGKKTNPFEILMIKKAVLNKSSFSVVNNDFRMNTSLTLPHSNLDVVGLVNKSAIEFRAMNAHINLEDFGNISQLDIKGEGDLDINVSGPPDRTRINLKGKTKGFEILGYKLDETRKDVTIDLGHSDVLIHNLESRLGKTSLSGRGSVNYENSDINLSLSANESTADDLREILTPIFKDLDFLPDDLDYKASVIAEISGKYKLPELNIKSKLNLTDVNAFKENLNSASFDVLLKEKVLSFNNLEARKGDGAISGDFSMDLNDKSMKLNYLWNNLEISNLDISKSMGLNLSGLLSGKITGGGPQSRYFFKMDSVLFNSRSQNYEFPNSNITFSLTPRKLSGDLNFFGKMITSNFNLSLTKDESSELDLKIKTDNIKPLLVALVGQHLEQENLTGEIHFEGSTSFKDGFEHLELEAGFKKLNFNHPEFNVNHTSSTPDFIVKDGEVKKWELGINQPDLYVVTKGEGRFGEQVTLTSKSQINAKLADVLLTPILSADGFIHNEMRVEGRGEKFNFFLSSKATDLDLSIDQLPIQINDLTYDIEYSSNRLNIKNLASQLDNGSFALKGDVFFDNNQPDLNLKFVFDRAEIPILGKSAINISGEGIVLGNSFPYAIGGEILLNKALIVNELNEFNTKSAGFSQVRFLPKNQESPIGKMFSLNFNVKAETPIRITNSLMDIALTGEVRLLGSPGRPRADGRLSSPVNSSRIFFKNNEYQIVSAEVTFNPKKEISNPDFDIKALTIISNYKVYPKAYGDLERFNFDLTSDPALPRNSILSLIAFGYTDEIQSSLYAKDQQSLTQVGVGSFVFDRFKISDILNKQFGLQVNLGTVIEQSTTASLLSGRNQNASGAQGSTGLGRTRSATKIELKKRLDEALTLSVSSTMGGTIGQRQSMNLNYGLSKSVQLEGVYELRTNEEGEADIIYNSIGGDLKFRRTFK